MYYFLFLKRKVVTRLNALLIKVKEVSAAVLPITLIVLILHFTLTPLNSILLIRFLLGAVFIIIGLSVFLTGVDLSISPIGNLMGSVLAKSNNYWIVAVAGLGLGFFISIAEPDLHVLAAQISNITSGFIGHWTLVIVVSVGIAVLLSLGLIRIVLNFPLYKLLTILYLLILVLALFSSPEFLAISFDASGATTGAMTVPFVMALSIGVSALKSDSKASEKDSFGLVAIASCGAIISVMIMSIFSGVNEISGSLEEEKIQAESFFQPFMEQIPLQVKDTFLALAPILILFLIFQVISFKLSRRAFLRVLIGMGYTYAGLVVFFIGVNAGFMKVGTTVGIRLAQIGNIPILAVIGFVIGCLTILAEPAVYVLTHQIETVTSGYVQRKVVLIALAAGVGVSIALSVLRVLVPGIQLWHYLLPGYVIAIGLMFFVPKLFVGIAFDSGGVASGPMTATFVLAFISGIAEGTEGADVLIDGFGVIAMVALTPLIALQVLGLIFKIKLGKGGASDADDSEPERV